MPAKDPARRIKGALHAHQHAAGALERLEASQRVREAAEELEADAIEEARRDGATWRQIGALYGLTKQGAQQRFGTAVDHAKGVRTTPRRSPTH